MAVRTSFAPYHPRCATVSMVTMTQCLDPSAVQQTTCSHLVTHVCGSFPLAFPSPQVSYGYVLRRYADGGSCTRLLGWDTTPDGRGPLHWSWQQTAGTRKECVVEPAQGRTDISRRGYQTLLGNSPQRPKPQQHHLDTVRCKNWCVTARQHRDAMRTFLSVSSDKPFLPHTIVTKRTSQLLQQVY